MVVSILHIAEQLVFGISQLEKIKRILTVYYGWFQQPDYGTVHLVAIAVTLVNALMFGILLGGKWRSISVGFMSLLALSEVHHVIEAIYAGAYNPGMITAIPYAACGALLLAALVRERHEDSESATPQAVVATL